MQDSHDTLTRIQDTEEGAQFSDLVSSAGGETLSATTKVGLTSTLENLQYAAARTSPRSIGTATATDALGITLTDSGASFVSDGVVRGDWIINFTDQSVTEVLTVTETAIVSRGLSDGTANTFTTGDSYKVWEVAEFGLDGGNFVAEDEFGAEISPLFTTFGRYSVKTSASSATQLEQAAIQFASYANASVWVDADSGLTGTVYPVGTSESPVNNTADAQLIANAVGLRTIQIVSDVTVTAGSDHTDMLFLGRSPRTTTLTIATGANVFGAEYQKMLLTSGDGAITGGTYVTAVAMKGVTGVAGHLEQCVIRGDLAAGKTYSIQGNGAGIMMLNKCSAVDAFNVGNPAIIDLNGNSMLALRQFSGEVTVVNKTGTAPSSIDMVAGKITLDATVTEGTFYIRGVGTLVDNSGPNVVVVNEIVSGVTQQLIETILRGRTDTDPTTGLMTVRDAAGNITLTAQLYEDTAGTQTYRGQGADRRERLQ